MQKPKSVHLDRQEERERVCPSLALLYSWDMSFMALFMGTLNLEKKHGNLSKTGICGETRYVFYLRQ